MKSSLIGKKVAILVTDGFEQSELEQPRAALEKAGAKAEVVSPKSGSVRGWDEDDFGKDITVDVQLKEAAPESYDALLLPGGVMNPDKLRGREVCASSSNRNFKGRQGSPTGRTVLMSPVMVAAAAITGSIADAREVFHIAG